MSWLKVNFCKQNILILLAERTGLVGRRLLTDTRRLAAFQDGLFKIFLFQSVDPFPTLGAPVFASHVGEQLPVEDANEALRSLSIPLSLELLFLLLTSVDSCQLRMLMRSMRL